MARTVRRLMIGVVREGTGTAAAIPGVTVAGKTGTAELKTACSRAARARPAQSKPARTIAAAGRLPGAEAKRATPTPGSPRSRRRCIRASSSACCSSKTAPAAPPPRRSRAKCSKPGCRRNRQLAVAGGPRRRERVAPSDVELGRGGLRWRRRDRRSSAPAGGCRARRPGSCTAAARPGWGRRRRSSRAPAAGCWPGPCPPR